jgi:hypothetical protein
MKSNNLLNGHIICCDDLIKSQRNGNYSIFFCCVFCEEKSVVTCYCGSEIINVELDGLGMAAKVKLKCAIDGSLSVSPYSSGHDSIDVLTRMKSLASLCHATASGTIACPKCGKLNRIITCLKFVSRANEDPLSELSKKIDRQKAEDAERKQLELDRANQRREDRRIEAISRLNECREKLSKLYYFSETILDSNIWMNNAYEPLFESLIFILSQEKKQVKLYGAQFDEICAVKKRSAFGSSKSAGARCALSRIERMQTLGLLRIEPLTIDAGGGGYADPLIVKLIVSHTRSGSHVCFVSDDVELRIRVRGLAGNSSGFLTLIEGNELVEPSRLFCIANGMNVIEEDIEQCYAKLSEGDNEFTNEVSGNIPRRADQRPRRRKRE